MKYRNFICYLASILCLLAIANSCREDDNEVACFLVATLDSKGNPSFVGIEHDYTSAFISGTSSKVTGASIMCIKN